MEIVCGLATKKPWLREQCGWLFCNCMKVLSGDFNRYLIQALARHRLLRTPEGVAVWFEQDNANMKTLRLDGLWKHGSPLARKGVSTLADIMKDAKPRQVGSGGDGDSQGKAMWSPQLHFAWALVLCELYQEASEDRVSFKDFWLHVVDRECYPTFPQLTVVPSPFTESANNPQRVCSHPLAALNEGTGTFFYLLKCFPRLQKMHLRT